LFSAVHWFGLNRRRTQAIAQRREGPCDLPPVRSNLQSVLAKLLHAMQVGEAFAENKTVTVAKMDATANDVPSSEFSVSDVRAEVNNAYPCATLCSFEATDHSDELSVCDSWHTHSCLLCLLVLVLRGTMLAQGATRTFSCSSWSKKKKKKKNPHQIHVLMTLAEMLQVSGFPTIMFVSGKDGSVISYDGNRQQEDMIKFINEHSSGLSPKSASKDEL